MTGEGRPPPPWLLWGLLAVSAAILAALPAVTGSSGSPGLPPSWPAGLLTPLAVSLAAAALARAVRAVTTGGAAAGGTVALLLLASSGWRGFLLLAGFVTAAAAATRVAEAARPGPAGSDHRDAGGRGRRNVIANGGLAALLGVAAAAHPGELRALLTVAMAASLATAFSDTISSEVGQLLGGAPVMITTLRPVPPGTDGAVSLTGTVAGAAASALMASLGWITGLVAVSGAAAVAAGGLAGNLADSLLGATLERRGWLDNDAVNYLATMTGAGAALLLAATTS